MPDAMDLYRTAFERKFGYRPEDMEQFPVRGYAEPLFGIQSKTNRTIRVHPRTHCQNPDRCVVHNPSDHHMRDWPLNYRADRGLMERFCEHGIGHPDPDDIAFHESQGRTYMDVHGCDGCCAPYEGKHRTKE